MEPLASAFTVFGLVILVASWIQLLELAFSEEFSWGMCSLFVPPLGYLFACAQWDKAKEPIVIAVLGWTLLFIGGPWR